MPKKITHAFAIWTLHKNIFYWLNGFVRSFIHLLTFYGKSFSLLLCFLNCKNDLPLKIYFFHHSEYIAYRPYTQCKTYPLFCRIFERSTINYGATSAKNPHFCLFNQEILNWKITLHFHHFLCSNLKIFLQFEANCALVKKSLFSNSSAIP